MNTAPDRRGVLGSILTPAHAFPRPCGLAPARW